MQFVNRRASSATVGYSNRPACSSPLSHFSITYSDPPSSPPSLASSSSASSGMSSSSPFRDSASMADSSESNGSFQRRRQSYKSSIPSRRSRQVSSASSSPNERFRRQTTIRIQGDRTKVVNSKRNGCGKDAFRTGLETAEELAVLRKMWMGDAQERTLQADPELHHLWESQQNLAQDEEPASDQEPYLDVIYEEDDGLDLAEQYEEMQREAVIDAGGSEQAVHQTSNTDLVTGTDMDIDIEEYLSDDSIFDAALSEPAFVGQTRPEREYDSSSVDMQE